MTPTYEEIKQQKIKETFKMHNIDKWHEMGYRGQGVKILNLEGYNNHGKDTYDDIKDTAPESQIDWCSISKGLKADKLYRLNIKTEYREFNLEQINEFGEFLKQYDIITVSQSGSYGSQLEDLFSKSGAILISSAGNDDFDGVTGRFKDIGFSIGAVETRNGEIHRERYSAVGEKVDFVFFHYEREGTSFSAPTFAGACACVISKYGKIDKYTMFEVMVKLSKDLGTEGHDEYYGHGLPVLPEDGTITVLEEMGTIVPSTWTFRMLHNSENYVEKGDIIEKGTLLCKMGNTGTKYAHLHLDAVKGIVPQYSLIDVENKIHEPYPEKMHEFITFDLFKYEPVVTNPYLVSNYKEDHNVDYEHWGVDSVPKNRHATDANYYVYFPLDTKGKVLDSGTYSDGTKYIIVGVDENMKFEDVDESKWSFKAIDYVSDKGYMTGYEDGTFKPEKKLTREEMAQILYNIDHK